MPRLAVIGGGPKGAAVAAKAQALATTGRYAPPDLVIYERQGIGAAWSGQSGYTDGLQPLCTPAERDLGYPYDRASFGRDVASAMFARFSWHSFCVAEGMGATEYDQWIMYGRSPPAHRDFARYLQSAVRRSGAQVFSHDVIGLDYSTNRNQWEVTSQPPGSAPLVVEFYDGVVITGSGEPLGALPGANMRVIDGRSFWLQIPAIHALLQSDLDPAIVIIGAGGTAAAIAQWFVRAGIRDIPITIVGREATLFARHLNWFEDRLFTDSVAWNALGDNTKDAFVARATKGIVWESVLQSLRADNLIYWSYDVSRFVPAIISTPTTPPPIYAELHDPVAPVDAIRTQAYAELNAPPPPPRFPSRPPLQLPATVFIDARGFDLWWFVDTLLINSPLSGHFVRGNRASIQVDIDHSLAIGGRFPAGLHVPMLASRQGPAAPNLMALGWMSDRILRPYVTPAPPTP